MNRFTIYAGLLLAVGGVTTSSDAYAQQDAQNDANKTFKVCRDPNNLPFSNSKSEGYEDKIAQLLADELGRKLETYEFASRFNFIRNTLKFKLPGEEYRCDIVIGVPAGFDQVSATKPYYR
jgi:mxaJ protein